MSLRYNDTSGLTGIIQLIEKKLGFDYGTISGSTTKMKEWTAAVNLAWDKYLAIALPASGTWQYDDSNQTNYPIIKTNLVDGQRDYTFTTDGSSNLILDIYAVGILSSATATEYLPVSPIDAQSEQMWSGIFAESTGEGVPYKYDKTANGIFLDPIPGYNATNGLKIYINREPSYFTTSDTTKKPGCPGLHHDYFVLEPVLRYAQDKILANKGDLAVQVAQMEKSIKEYFGKRSRDERQQITTKRIKFR